MNSATTGLPWEIVAWQRRKPGRRVEREAGAVVLVEVLPVTEAPPQERRGAARISNPHGRVRGGGAVTSKAAPFKKRRMTTSQRKAIAELRRITRRRLIIVVPREREYRYTFNPHFNFFPYTHSFLRAMHPVPAEHTCVDIGRDIFYCEDRTAAAE